MGIFEITVLVTVAVSPFHLSISRVFTSVCGCWGFLGAMSLRLFLCGMRNGFMGVYCSSWGYFRVRYFFFVAPAMSFNSVCGIPR